jgi:hypothetical protein
MKVEITTDGPLNACFTEVKRVEMTGDYICVSEESAEFESRLLFGDVAVTVETQGKLGIYFGGSTLATEGSIKLRAVSGQVVCEGPIFRIRSSGITVMASAEEKEEQA